MKIPRDYIFEKEGINTIESSGELLLTLFSCFAQEESRSISENTAWGIRSRFRQGVPHINAENLMGYDKDEAGRLVINEKQAEVVRRIYSMFLEGFSLRAIAEALNREGVPGVHGEAKWCAVTISRMLQNEKYKGALLMQKTYTENFLTKRHVPNTGQLDCYYIEHDHPPVIPPLEWEAVQQEIARRREFRAVHGLRGMFGGGSPFYSRLFCSVCGERMQLIQRKGVKRPYWICMECGQRVGDAELRAAFCGAFNSIVRRRNELIARWNEQLQNGTELERVRAGQMIEITAGGELQYEVPELTQAVLQEAWLGPDGHLSFVLLTNDRIQINCSQ